jgi:invasion protein IalB
MKRSTSSKGSSHVCRAALAMALASTTVLAVGATPAQAEPGGFCGALVQGHDAWYRNCTSLKVWRAADQVLFDTCVEFRPYTEYHWHDSLFNIRGIYTC